ncbi:uncharacterized protein LOC109715948 isoform X3 [Ananas comosus]|uniref:Uncharacterized protein LOC109715948 isoform X3 n=1 Tax=Ananas comosus TaxID=4615 RepID=A0A6P5FKC8_ANACO|nr:uncharacterized protein LOC109715948 isoform X3 [Ananas comosus]XP_020096781.1 uncharacterized protein LOC109715948 isoform X3 [Ananas comosus]
MAAILSLPPAHRSLLPLPHHLLPSDSHYPFFQIQTKKKSSTLSFSLSSPLQISNSIVTKEEEEEEEEEAAAPEDDGVSPLGSESSVLSLDDPQFRCSIKKHTIIRHNPPKLVVPKFAKPQQIAARRAASLKLTVRRESFKKAEHGVGEEDGVIIVDHGSRRQQSNLMLNEFVAMFKARTGYRIVEPAHMELAEPSISDAFRSCVQQGANRVILSPFFLLPGRHWQQDIPSLAAQASKEHSGVSYVVTAPLGLHDLLVILKRKSRRYHVDAMMRIRG